MGLTEYIITKQRFMAATITETDERLERVANGYGQLDWEKAHKSKREDFI